MSDRESILLNLRPDELARFGAKVWKLDGSCWPWIGAVIRPEHGHHSGYGCLTIRSQSFRAHRVALILATGKPIDPGLDVCHTCDYRRCCNPDHLQPKTRERNVADMMARGRHWSQGFAYVEPPFPVVPPSVKLAGLREILEANFWIRMPVDRPKDICWEWTGSRDPKGYGRIEMKCKTLGIRERHPAHVLSYELHVGPIPNGLEVCHSCDNPPCVNPAHLKPGTHAENMAQMKMRGRSRGARGEAHYKNKLTAAQVNELRSSVASGTARRVVAERLGIHVQTVHDIVNGKSWKHLPT